MVVPFAVLVLAAALDAFLAGGDMQPAPPRQEPEAGDERTRAVRDLERHGVSGVLLVTDTSCRLRALRLPHLEAVVPPEVRRCGADGRPLESDCRRRDLEIVGPGGEVLYAVAGCAPRRTESSANQALTTLDLRRAFSYDANIPRDPAYVRSFLVERVAWLNETRFVLLLRVEIRHGPTEDLVVVYEGDRPIRGEVHFGGDSNLVDLNVSPRGTYFAWIGADDLVLFDRRGHRVVLPRVAGGLGDRSRLPDARDVAWSADEEWTAVATEASVYLFRTGESDSPLIRLPLAVADVAWLSGPAVKDG